MVKPQRMPQSGIFTGRGRFRMMQTGKTEKTMFRNAVLMTAVSLGLRTAGIYYRAQMRKTVGLEGVGLYTLTQTAFLFAVTAATAGLHTAVTMVLSENAGKGNRRAVRDALGYALLMGLAAGALLFILAPVIAGKLLGDARCTPSLRILSPALPVMAAAAVFKGFFYAQRQAGFVALSDVLEQGVEMTAFFLAAERLAPMGLTWACASIAIGTTVSEISSCTMLAVAYIRAVRHEKLTKESHLGRIQETALPVTGSAVLGAGLRTAENTMVPRGLIQYGMDRTAALGIYGQVRAMALPLIFYPSSLIGSLASLMIPELSENRAAGKTETMYPAICRLLKLTMWAAFGTAGLLWAFSREIAAAVFQDVAVGKILLLLSPLVPLMYLEMVTDGMLKGLDQQVPVLRVHLADAGVRAGLVMILVPKWGVAGFIGMMYLSNIVTPLASLIRLLKVTGLRFEWREWLLIPGISAGFAAAVSRWGANQSENVLSGTGSVILCCILCCLLFAGSIWLCSQKSEGRKGRRLQRKMVEGR